jgi:hypothetical protein
MSEKEQVQGQKQNTTHRKAGKKTAKNRSEKCAFCNTVDVIESGYYSKDLGTKSNKDNESEDEHGDYWFCCVLHNWMYKHKHGIANMPSSTYNEEIKKINMKRNMKRNRERERERERCTNATKQ